jgi:5-methylcytosine-specific restriction endonuclease McrA
VEEEVGANGRALCRWCRMEVLAKRRRTFCSDYCVHQWRLRSDPGYLRDQVFLRDKGVCALCGTDAVSAYAELKRSRGKARAELLEVWGMRSVGVRRSLWDADHVRPVAEGGGEENLRSTNAEGMDAGKTGGLRGGWASTCKQSRSWKEGVGASSVRETRRCSRGRSSRSPALATVGEGRERSRCRAMPIHDMKPS